MLRKGGADVRNTAGWLAWGLIAANTYVGVVAPLDFGLVLGTYVGSVVAGGAQMAKNRKAVAASSWTMSRTQRRFAVTVSPTVTDGRPGLILTGRL